MLNAHRTKFN